MALAIKLEQNSLIVKSDSFRVTEDDGKKFIEVCSTPQGQYSLVIFDVSIVNDVQPQFFDRVIEGAEILKKRNVELVMLANAELADHLTLRGTDELIRCFVPSPLGEAENSAKSYEGTFDSEVAQAFLTAAIEAVVKTISTYSGYECKSQSIKKQNETPDLQMDIAGTIGLVGRYFRGAITLAFPMQTFLKLMSIIHKKEFKTLDPTLGDWAGELVNVVLGQIKSKMNAKEHGISPALPTVMHGALLQAIPLRSSSYVIVPFESSFGNFYMKLSTVGNDTLKFV